MTDPNPLCSDDPRDWERLIDSLGPASLLVAIEGRMSAERQARVTAEDILQDTLLHLWRDRARIEWRGAKSFRSLVISMAIHRIQDAADSANAAKRGGGLATFSLEGDRSGSQARGEHSPVRSTTPSRVAMHRERAETMRAALESLPVELRDVVRLRTLEQLPLAEIAAQLEIGLSAVRHRLRKGSELYAERLKVTLASSDVPPDSTADSRSSSSS